jgi:hypothetical protein
LLDPDGVAAGAGNALAAGAAILARPFQGLSFMGGNWWDSK